MSQKETDREIETNQDEFHKRSLKKTTHTHTQTETTNDSTI